MTDKPKHRSRVKYTKLSDGRIMLVAAVQIAGARASL
jgi:hypothetical protein